MPHKKATRISFQSTLGRSPNSISFKDRPRITETEAWLPEFPAVPISMGMKAVSTT